MPQPPLVYLDTQQWRYLDDGPEDGGPGLDPATFRRATRSGRFRVLASLDLIGELVNAVHGRPDFVGRVVPQILHLAGPRVLQPLHVRLALEIKQSGMLPVRKRYLPAPERQVLHQIQANEPMLRAMADEARVHKAEFDKSEKALRELVIAKLTEAGVPLKPGILHDWYESHDREEWVKAIAEGGQERGLFTMPDVASWGYGEVPSLYTFVSFRQARIVHTVGENRKITPSDLDDAYHAAAGPYYDVLVTDDRAFGYALDEMPDRPFDWMTSEKFSAAYLG